MLKKVASLWIGSRLGPIELAAIRSFVRLGHEFTLFAYEEIENRPPDVIFRDAREILDTGRIIRHQKTGSPALHSDIFRYTLICKTEFIWVDLDIIALRPFDFPSDHIFGYEAEYWLNGAVLRLPSDSFALRSLATVTVNTKGLPPHLTGLRKLKYQLRNILSGGLPIDRWPWGAIGPKLLTLELRKSGEISHALPVSAFYSIPLAEARRFADPGAYTAKDAPADAYAVHLWASHLTRYVAENYGGTFPSGSFVNRVCNDEW
ncbi:hypothetical protein LY56_01719 [Roseinatronobacter thiooxidans]|uniref:Glycosyl transferase-like sugar-binding protein n=1 Tax=Roseinatronobacter thiooxidans TaxID=121821 RepID=A0A2W7QAL7_9RHOB|nr:hypothetical protein [Roseinatronobacter thiooxidans]PZX45694.1 hypothetical protein LY56_01719 [Roseinatronobacter thiooxidans]